MKKSKLLLYDPMIISRVRQYLEENVHQTYVDVAVMAKELQDRHRDYGRRKIAPFRQLVEQAYKTVLHSYGLDSNPSSDNEGDPSDIELMDENDQTNSNHMNNTITSLYMNNKKTTPSNEGELIDISSDEDMENYSRKSNKKPITEKGNEMHPILKKSIMSGGNSMSTFGNSTNIFGNSVSIPGNSTSVTLNPVNTSAKHANSHENSTTNTQVSQANTKKRKMDGIPPEGLPLPTSKPRKYKKTVSSTLSNISFKNVGGMEKILKELCELLLHVKHPDVYHHLGLPPPRGFLLHGPPGSGKTLLAQAIAGQLEVPLIQVAATELVAGVSGESEERIREVFEQAACVAPCVLFIDEVDAISANRQNAQKDMERRIVAQLLSSLDGLSKQVNGDMVLVIGAANSPDTLDPSLRRVGRFDQEICLGIPDRDSRAQILRVICDDLKLERPFDYDYLASLTPGFVGADLLALATRAATTAVKRAFSKKEETMLRKKITENENNSIVPVDLTDDLLMNDENDSINNKSEETKNDSINDVEENKEISVDNDTNENTIIDVQNDSEKITLSEPEPLKSNSEIVDAIVDAIVENKKSELAELKETELMDEIVKEAEIITHTNTTTEEINDVITKEILKQPQLKLQITLTEMMKWLNGNSPLISENELHDLCITMKDFKDALKVVQPSAKREGFITVPDVTWDDIGSLRDIREELKLAILAPVKYPNKLKALGLHSPSGVLLCGPPGCGKTLLAKAIANEAGINFISVKGPELLNMYVGESERAVRQCFQRARNSAPCVIFFDEFDALCPKRSDSTEGGAGMRVVNQLLTEMDGVEDRKGVFLMAATNRPDIVDPAVLRPGRLDKTLYVGFPNTEDRLDILKAITKKGTKPTLAPDVDLKNIAICTDGYTGADLAGLIRQASLQALKMSIANETIPATDSTDNLAITNENMLSAISRIKPSISLEEKLNYDKLRLKYAAPQQLNNEMDH